MHAFVDTSIPDKGTSDNGDSQQMGYSDIRVLSFSWNAFIYIVTILTKMFAIPACRVNTVLPILKFWLYSMKYERR